MNQDEIKKMLQPLKNRNDLEPQQEFINELRLTLSHPKQKKTTMNFAMLTAMGTVMVLFSIIVASYVTNGHDPKQSETVPKIVKEVPVQPTRDFSEILSTNLAYKVFYDVFKNITEKPEHGMQVIFYFEAVKNKDVQEMKKFVPENEAEDDILKRFDSYETMDISTLKLMGVASNEKEMKDEVLFSYMDSKTNEHENASIIIDFTDQAKLTFFDKFHDWNSQKDEQVAMKLKEIALKMKLGMSKQEALELFGKNNKVVINPNLEDGSVETWDYRYFVEKEYIPTVDADYEIDVPRFQDQSIGIQHVISWSKEGKALWMSVIYGLEKKVYMKKWDRNGMQEELLAPLNSMNQSAFQLTSQEEKAYAAFKANHNEEELKGLSPISVAKLYVQSALDGDFETEFELYTKRKDRVMWSKEEHLKNSANEHQTKAQILEFFSGISDGEFIQTSDYEGYIKFENSGFQMVKDEKGIWKVSFMPIQ